MEFKNKVALITGAAAGIGKEAAIMFATKGAKVVVSDIDEEKGKETVHQIISNGRKAAFIKCDVSKESEVKEMVAFTIATYGQLDIAVNNAGIGGENANTIDIKGADFDKMMAINCNSVFYGMKYQIPQMLKQGNGSIVNTSSIAGLKGLPKSLPYVAAKHAVIGMTKTAAMEYAKKGIRINAICPVFTVTNLFNPELFDSFMPGISDKLKSSIPMKRFGTPKEIASGILWLSSEYASFVTGLALPVDGGLTA